MWKWETESEAKGVIVIAHNLLEHTGRYAYVITSLRRNGYHVIMGDLPGQGQTSRSNKGQIDNFEVYHEHIMEWLRIASEYKLPTFLMGVGLGGLITLNLLERTELPIEGIILLSPLAAFQKNNKTRKNMLTSNVGAGVKDMRFNLGIEPEHLTRNEEVIEETKQDGLMLKKVSYHWYKEVVNVMKKTMEHLEDIQSIPMCLMYGKDDKIVETEAILEIKNRVKSDELYFKAWDGLYHEIHNEPERPLVMRYILSYLNNKVNALGFIPNDVDDQIEI
ncbi:alpha/beta fold hydrolase [Staphylococcus carnosus]|uniref:Lysophospholipase n=1 Tax=Staphylococcus carnosus TaxID=1281 RepID=A0AAJ0JQB2_STACA|nr:alpha/beta hydrolase [Staphylococcus carnosus]KKB25997.1 lysophospholipase [Staphylococcus carnosus]PNZ99942.1 alpha/beta hydrolase [Staphylococcus carnosus]QQS84961.1 alpha/beta hydrolase [Staphylococcus carnosus]QRQ04900.1 alpha/beta hydrolase [Staphylococcus carnosus]UTB83102.1 lysophospholipase [Staphylococcus carnosus]